TQPADDGTPGFGVYIHWPFCAQKCPYCDFNSHVRFGGWDEPRFLAAYKRELNHIAALMSSLASSPPPLRGRQGGGDSQTRAEMRPVVTSIFFGGGTPSLMQPETVAAIIEHIRSLWPVTPAAEITLEANPG